MASAYRNPDPTVLFPSAFTRPIQKDIQNIDGSETELSEIPKSHYRVADDHIFPLVEPLPEFVFPDHLWVLNFPVYQSIRADTCKRLSSRILLAYGLAAWQRTRLAYLERPTVISRETKDGATRSSTSPRL